MVMHLIGSIVNCPLVSFFSWLLGLVCLIPDRACLFPQALNVCVCDREREREREIEREE